MLYNKVDLISFLEAAATGKNKGVTFISDSHTENFVSYKDLLYRAGSVWEKLRSKGAKAGDEMVLQVSDNESFVVLFWAGLLGKMIPVPLALGNQEDHLLKLVKVWSTLKNPIYVTETAQVRKVRGYADKNRLNRFGEQVNDNLILVEELLAIEEGWDFELTYEQEMPSSSDTAYIQFSSGSTGDPKGVELTHGNLVTNVMDICSRSEITKEDSMLSWMPLTHDMGLICFHLSGVFSGVNQFIMPTSLFIRRPILWMEKAAQHKISLLYSPNFGLKYFLSAIDGRDATDWDLSHLRLIYNGAEPISKTLCAQFEEKMQIYGLRENVVFPGYGLAEASVAVTLPDPGDPLTEHIVKRVDLTIGSSVVRAKALDKDSVSFVEVGRPIDHTQVRISDDQNRVMTDDTVGHIQIKGENVTKAYYQNPKATEKLFTEDGWLRTGDLGFTSKGRLIVTGRHKNVIIINGQNYYPQDIEQVIQDEVGIDLGKVVAIGDRSEDAAIEQLIILTLYKGMLEKFHFVRDSIKRAVLEKIGLTVDLVIPIRKVPKTTSGKVQHYKLLSDYRNGAFDEVLAQLSHHKSDYRSGETLQVVQQELKSLTALEDIDGDTALRDLGMNSLMAMQLIGRLNAALEVKLTIRDVFETPSVASLIKIIDERPKEKTETIRPLPSKTCYTLSPAQQRLWVMDGISDRKDAYNVALAYRMEGILDIHTFEKAFEQLVDKYEILRTIFVISEDIPHQKILSSEDIDFKVCFQDISRSPEKAQSIVNEYAGSTFDLGKGPLFRAVLLRLSDRIHLFSLTIHHIITDGYSISLLLSELAAFYRQQSIADSSEPTPLTVHYKDCMAWRSDTQSLDKVQESKEYWREELGGELPILDLYGKSNLFPHPTFNGNLLSFTFSEKETRTIREFSRYHGATDFMTLLAAVNALVYKYSSQEDVIIGTDIAGRDTKEMENQLGYFLKTLCIRTKFRSSDSFLQLLTHVKNKVLAGFEHQDYSYDSILEDLGLKSTINRSPLFDILVLFQNFDHSGWKNKMENLTIEDYSVQHHVSIVDLQFDFIPKKEQLQLDIRYNTDRFSAMQIEKLIRHLNYLIHQVMGRPEVRLSELDILLSEERRQLIAYSRSRSEDHISLEPVHVSFEKQAAQTPRHEAIVCGERRFTYQQINEKANQIARGIKERSAVSVGDRIGIMMGRSALLIPTIFAVLKTGATYVPIDPDFPEARVNYILHDSKVSLLLTDTASAEGLIEVQHEVIIVDSALFQSSIAELSPIDSNERVENTHLAYIIYTSATTGDPKGVMIPHSAMSDYVATFKAYFQIDEKDAIIQQSSIAFDTFVEEVFPVLSVGGKLVIAEEGGKNTDELLEVIQKHRATVLSTTPLVIKELNQHAESLSSLRAIISGGDKLLPSYISNLWGTWRLFNTYGPSETTVCVTFNEIEKPEDAEIIGTPIAHHQIYLLDENHRLKIEGGVGEIAIGGAGLASGYFNRPELTEEKFVDDPYRPDEKMYLTGDLGRWTTGGKIEFLGRKDFQVKIGGYRVELEEIEKVLMRHELISDVVAMTTESGQLHAYLVSSKSLTKKELRNYLSTYLPYYMIPSKFVGLSAFPLTTMGKVDRKGLLQTKADDDEQQYEEAPLSDLGVKILESWSKVLDINELRAEDDFFEYGGNSIKATQLIAVLSRDLKVKVSIKDIFLNPTVKDLVSAIELSKQEMYKEIPQQPEQEFYEVSNAQKRLWVLSHLGHGTLAYNEYESYELEGHLDMDSLKSAFTALLQRHQVLRTTFVSVDGEPRQKINALWEYGFEIGYTDIQNSEHIAQKLSEQVDTMLTTAFDLESGPLLKVDIKKVAANSHVLFIALHHIITDDWSGKILMQELLTLYSAALENKPSPLGELRLQYRDYALWNNNSLSSGLLENDKNYWLNRLSGELPVLNLPTDYKRPHKKLHEGAISHFLFDKELVNQVKTFSKSQQVSTFATLLTALNVLIYRYSHQSDLIIGTAVAGRNHPGLDEQLGMYINTLPLRSKLKGGESFKGLLQRIKHMVFEALEHQDYPFDLLVESLGLRRDLSRAPLFDVMVSYQSTEQNIDAYQLGNLTLQRRAKSKSASKYDLTFYFEESPRGMALRLEYDCSLFAESTALRMGGHLMEILRYALSNEGTAIAAIDYLPTVEKEQLLKTFNPKRQDYPKDKNVYHLFKEQVEKCPQDTSVVFREKAFTYADIDKKVDGLAAQMKADFAVLPNDTIGILLGRSEKVIVTILAIWKLGARYVPIDPQHPIERMNYILEDTGLELLVTVGKYLPLLEKVSPSVRVITTDSYSENTGMEEQSLKEMYPLKDSEGYMAYVLYTSGSTGKPKGVEVGHVGLTNFLLSMKSFPGFTKEDRLIAITTYVFDISIMEMFLPLICGGQVVVVASADTTNTESLQRIIEEEQVTMMQATPSMWSLLMESGWKGRKDLRVLTGGERLSDDLNERLSERAKEVWNMYGPTETTVWATCAEVSGLNHAPIGKPIHNTGAYVVDTLGQMVPIGVYGELYLDGDGLAQGYLNKPELTKERFKVLPLVGKRCYQTGDIVRWLPDGSLEYLSRVDDQVKVRGHRIEPGEIDSVLRGHEQIKEAATLAIPNERGEYELVSYYVADKDVMSTELRSYLSTVLPSYMVPTHMVNIDHHLPMTPSGKLDKKVLPLPVKNEKNGNSITTPQSKTEYRLCQVWTTVLAIDEVGTRQSFFEVGGHSLRAIRLISAIEREFGIKIVLEDVFVHSTIAEQARLIENKDHRTLQKIPTLPLQEHYEVTPSQKQFWMLDQMEEKLVYTMPAVHRLSGDLDERAFARAFDMLIQRHESFRTRFRTIDGEVRQVIENGNLGFKIEKIDLSKDNNPNRELAQRIEEESKCPFDLMNGPLVRAQLIRMHTSEYVFLFTMHHIIADGWSIEILIREVLSLYAADIDGRTHALPLLEVQHKEYAAWYNQVLREEEEENRSYWKATFADGVPLLNLPTESIRPARKTFYGDQKKFSIDKTLKNRLKEIAQQNEASLYMVLLATQAIVYHKYSAQTDMVIGTPIANRDRAELQEQIGYFICNVPLRLTFDATAPFDELLKSTKEVLLEADKHKNYPLEYLVEDLQLKRDFSRSLLYDVGFTWHGKRHDYFDSLDTQLTIEAMDAGYRFAQTDIWLFGIEKDEGIDFVVEYSTDLFDERWITTFIAHYENLLEEIVTKHQEPLTAIEYMQIEERDIILSDFNDTLQQNDYERTIVEVFEDHVAAHPEAVAIVFKEVSITYKELNERANRLAHYLRQEFEVERNTLVGIMLHRSEQVAVSILAIVKAGGAYVPIDPDLPKERINCILEDTGLHSLLTDSESMFSLEGWNGNLFALDIQMDLIDTSDVNPKRINTPDDLAYVIYTSGSTGRPKGVLIEHHGVINLTQWQKVNFRLSEESNIFQNFSYSFDGAVGETFMALLNGATLCMYSKELTAEQLIAFINRYQVDVGVFVPSMLRQLEPSQIEHIHRMSIVSVGEVCSQDLAKKWSAECRFMNAYGPTEYTVYSHLYEIEQSRYQAKGTVPVGEPIFNTHSYILDKFQKPVAYNIEGEMYLSGPGIARGYLNNNVATLSKFVPNPYFLSDKYELIHDVQFEGSKKEIEDFRSSGFPLAVPEKNQEAYEINDIEALSEKLSALDEDIRLSTIGYIENHRDNKVKYDCFCRYFFEGLYHSYASVGINEEVLNYLFPFEDGLSGKKGVELGFGNAEIMNVLRSMDADIHGLELSPYSVQYARQQGLSVQHGVVDVEFNAFRSAYGMEIGSKDFALSTLLLDRVEKPHNLIGNLLGVLKEGGRFALQTLLPVVPIDDGDVENKIVYSQEKHWVCMGQNEADDKLRLVQVLYHLGARDIRIVPIPYVVASRDGIQEYTLWSFSGTKTFVFDPQIHFSRMYKTGDMAKYLPDGNIDFIGRSDDQVKLRGYRIELGEIERTLEKHASIEEAVVMVKADNVGDKSLHAYLTTGSPISKDEVKAYLKTLLPYYMIPSTIALLESMPLNTSGKVDRSALLGYENDSFSETTYEAPETPHEKMVARLWMEILDRERVSKNDNFFELGGHSLKATRFISRLAQQFDVEVEIGAIFKCPTVREIARIIENTEKHRFESIEIIREQSHYELSHAQKRIWLLSELDDTGNAYNICGAHRIKGKLDIDALSRSFQLLVSRHEILRTNFYLQGDKLVQQVKDVDTYVFPMEHIDLCGHSHQEKVLSTYAEKTIRTVFDLKSDPLMKVTLLQVEVDSFVLLFAMHHIISDGWSTKVLVEEVVHAYETFSQGRVPRPKPLKVNYKDYANWHGKLLKGPAMEKHKEFWLQQFQEQPTPINLPSDYGRPPLKSFNGSKMEYTIPRALLVSLRKYARSNDVSSFMLLITVLKLMIYKYTDQNDITLGTPVLGRDHIDLEGQIGVYINTIALRTRFDKNITFHDLLQGVKKTTVEAYDHQSLPFDYLVEKLDLKRDLSRSPLFDIIVSHENEELHGDGLNTFGEVEISPFPLDVHISQFDLSFRFIESTETLSLEVEFNTDMFSERTISVMVGRYRQLLTNTLSEPNTKLTDIAWLETAEQHRLLLEFNATDKQYGHSRTVLEMFEEQVAQNPKAIALISGSEQVTYGMLEDKSVQIAATLYDAGVREGDVVGVLVEKSIALVAALFGLFKVKACYVPIDTTYPDDRIRFILSDCRAKTLLVDSDVQSAKRYGVNVIHIANAQTDNTSIALLEENFLDNDSLAYIIYTSGTTGRPKGVGVSHANLSHFLENVKENYGADHRLKMPFIASHAFDISLFQLLAPLTNGGQSIIIGKEALLEMPHFVALLKKASMLDTVPALYQRICDHIIENGLEEDFQGIERLFVGGDVIPDHLLTKLAQTFTNADIVVTYGPTEGTIFCTSIQYPKSNHGELRKGNILGRPLDNVKVHVLDTNNKLQPIGVVGELCIAGAGVATGYFEQPQLTNSSFIDNPYGSGKLYRTGDLARWNNDGKLEFMGRADHQVKVRGYRIELGEIERMLSTSFLVKETVATVFESNTNEKLICVFFIAEEPVEKGLLRSYLRNKLPEYMIPADFVQLEAFPLNSNGKIDKKELLSDYSFQGASSETYEAPKGYLQESLITIWEEVLEISPIGVNSNFFELGGHSLKATKVVSKILKSIGIDTNITSLFRYPTVKELAIQLKKQGGLVYEPISPIDQAAYYEVSLGQKRLWILHQMEGQKASYNIPGAYRIDRQLDSVALCSGFNSLIDRHEILRTTFLQVDGELRQKVHEKMEFELEGIDLKDSENPMEEAYQWMFKEAEEPFDLEQGPLLRAKLLELAEQQYVLLFTIHHIISDAWSMNVLITEVMEAYNCYQEEKTYFKTPLAIHYKDYAAWQRKTIQEPVYTAHKDFWEKLYDSDIPMLDLPLDRQRPLLQSFAGDAVSITLERELSQAIISLSTTAESSLFMFLIASVNVLLYKYSGQGDIVIGTPVAGREHPDLEEQIGFYVNTLPLRNQLSADDRFSEVLENVKSNTLKAYEHQSYPFDLLVESLDLRRDLSRSPLFDVMVALHASDHELVDNEYIRPLEVKSVSSKFDITFNFHLTKNGTIRLEITYSTALFNKDRMERALEHYRNIAKAVSGEFDAKIKDIDYLSHQEYTEIIQVFNDSRSAYPYGQTIVEAFEQQVAQRPEQIGIIFGNQRLTYNSINERANQLAHQLITDQNVCPQDFVGIVMEKSPMLIISLLAVLKAGAVYVPIDPSLPAERIAYILKDTQLSVLLYKENHTAEGVLSGWNGTKVKVVDSVEDAPARINNPKVRSNDADPAYIIYTSGSTGQPKGVLVPHRGVVNLTNWQQKNFTIGTESRVLQHFSYSFDGAIGETFMAMLNGATLCMYSEYLTPEGMVDFINEQQISVGVFVPSLLHQMSPEAIKHIDKMSVVSVGEVCPPSLARKWSAQCRFMNAYGPTEYSVYSHLHEVDYQMLSLQGDSPVAIGKPISNTDSYILDNDGNPVSTGVEGDLYLSGLGMAEGYLHNTVATLEKFLPNPFFLSDKYEDRGRLQAKAWKQQVQDFRKKAQKQPPITNEAIQDISKLYDLTQNLDADIAVGTKAFLDKHQGNPVKYEGFSRYFLEGYHNSYASVGMDASVVKQLFALDDFTGKKGVELGFGNAEVLSILQELGAEVIGFELSPFFIQRARDIGLEAYLAEVDLPFEEFCTAHDLLPGSKDFSLSTLLLDRVEYPQNLIKNLLGVLKEDGRFALQTLLPIVPEDDGGVEEKIVYTQNQDRICLGKNMEEDKLKMVQVFYDLGARDIVIRNFQLIVSSRDGIQEYTIWSFSGRKTFAKQAQDHYSRMYRTGDRAKYLPDGNVMFLGRQDDQIKLRGYRIEIGEIERALEKYQEVNEAVVLVKEDTFRDKSLVAFVVGNVPVDESALRGYLRQVLPAYMIPSTIVQLDSFPLNNSGKVDRKKLPIPTGRSTDLDAVETGPMSKLEKQIVGIWEDILGKKNIGPSDNFFELGGHSLKATRLVTRLYKILGIQLDLVAIFKFPTPELMATHIESQQRDNYLPIIPIDEKSYYEVSNAQKRMWFLNQLDPLGTQYNISGAHHLYGKLNVEAFRKAFDALFVRHEILRSVIVNIEGMPKQRILDVEKSDFKMVYLDYRNEDTSAEKAQVIIREESNHVFDLEKPPLLRGILVHVSEEHFIFILTLHHIIADGWSMKVLIKDLLQHYSTSFDTEVEKTTPLKIQYKDYVVWYEELLQQKKLLSHKQYWESTLQELPPQSEFYSALTVGGTEEKGTYTLSIPTQVTDNLKKLSLDSGSTVFIVLLTALKVLLYRYTGENDIIVGTPVSGRIHPDLENQIGFYVNTLPIRTTFKNDDTLKTLLQTVRDSVFSAWKHQAYPYDEIIRDLHRTGQLIEGKLFNVMISYTKEDQSTSENDLEGIKIKSQFEEQDKGDFDLDIMFMERADGSEILCSVNYKVGVFDTNTMVDFKDHLLKIIHYQTHQMDTDLIDIEMVSDQQTTSEGLSEDEPLFNF